MGFFSWLTVDTEESIPNSMSDRYDSNKEYYLLLPGKHGRKMTNYDGYGKFWMEDTDRFEDIHEILGKENLPRGRKFDSDSLRDLGIAIEVGKFYEDKKGRWFICSAGMEDSVDFLNFLESNGFCTFSNYDQKRTGALEQTANWYIEHGQWEEVPFSHFMKELLKKEGRELFEIKIATAPLKYENFSPSKQDPAQGYFYSEEKTLSVRP